MQRWHALGNVYLVVEGGRLTPERVRALAGGADGVVEVLRAADDEIEIRIWNADGSTAEISGNATRIAARWLAQRTGAQTVRVRVGGRVVVARALGDDLIEQDMGDVVVGGPEEADGIRFVRVDVGNPHAVVEGDPADIVRIGPALTGHAVFPRGTNVQVARVQGPGDVAVRVWERGVGETSSSGTSAVAVAAALHGEGECVVRFPGGDLRVRLDGRRAFLIGPAERLA